VVQSDYPPHGLSLRSEGKSATTGCVVQVSDYEEAFLLWAASEAEMRHFPAALWSMTRCSTARIFSAPRRRRSAACRDYFLEGAFAHPRRATSAASRVRAKMAVAATRDVVFAPRCRHAERRLVASARPHRQEGRICKACGREQHAGGGGYDLPAGRGRRLVVDLSGDEAHNTRGSITPRSIPPSGRPPTTRGRGPLPDHAPQPLHSALRTAMVPIASAVTTFTTKSANDSIRASEARRMQAEMRR
jgi:hypothetical protein